MNKSIKIESISKKYSDESGHSINIFENISFSLESGKVTTILLPSKKGKTTLLKTVAKIDDEFVTTDGKRVLIPQKPSSFPWLNVRENILFNLNKIDEEKFKNVIKLVGIVGYEDHFPNNKSIGFRFRITLARAVINNPELILIDDSISEVSSLKKMEYFELIRKIASETGIPILYSTSSISEAIPISDKILLFNQFPANEVTEKEIPIEESLRFDKKSIFNIQEYFSDLEILNFRTK